MQAQAPEGVGEVLRVRLQGSNYMAVCFYIYYIPSYYAFFNLKEIFQLFV